MTRLITFSGENLGDCSNLLTKEQWQEFHTRQVTLLNCKVEAQASIEKTRSNCRMLEEKFGEIEKSFKNCSLTFSNLETISERNAKSWEAIRSDINKMTELLRNSAKTIRENLARGNVSSSTLSIEHCSESDRA
jgi:hypothetical protein